MDIAVVGSGVVGLSTAHELANLAAVTVIHRDALMATTSAVATAMWHVYLVDPDDWQNLQWSSITLRRLMDIAVHHPEAAIELKKGVELFRTSPKHLPPWSQIALDFQILDPKTVARDYPGRTWGYELRAPMTNMAKYLPWLKRCCEDRGVRFRERTISTLDELSEYDYVVNCTGLGAKDLTNDPALYAVKGQYLVLDPQGANLDRYIGDDENEEGMAYAVMRDGQLLVGGTEEHGVDSMDWTVDESQMRERASRFCELQLNDLPAIDRVVGHRPSRRGGHVRFGPDAANPRLVHNYGHGGSGFSLAWGCAESVRNLLLP